jgi:hypothetical protein
LQTVERRTIRKISWRLLPLIVIIYFVAYIDRTNVSFAALTMTPTSSAGVPAFSSWVISFSRSLAM